MQTTSLSPVEMAARLARFSELQSSPNLFLDNVLPGYQRRVYNIIGTGVSESPDALKPAIKSVDGFNMQMSLCQPNNGTALHSHDTVEVFLALTSDWLIKWGDNAEHEIRLGPWDVISVPAGVMRNFTNVGKSEGFLIAILGGTDAGRVTWAEQIIADARKAGSHIGEDGNLVRDHT